MGFVRIVVSSNSQVLASSPFHALQDEATLSSVGVLSWDADSGYTNEAAASSVVGQGFWLVNAAATQSVVFLSGEVPLDAETGVALWPGLNMIGHPFPAPVGVEATGLDPASLSAADGSRVSTLRPGEGYWYQHAEAQPVVWMEARPYANPFPTNGLPPQIVGLQVVDSGSAVRLTIVPGIQTSVSVDVYYQDLDPVSPFDPVGGWLPAGVAFESNSDVCIWEDRGSEGRHPPTSVLGRLYLAAIQGVDLDEALRTPATVWATDGLLKLADPLVALGGVDAAPADEHRGRAEPAIRYVSPQGTHQSPFTSWETAATNVQTAFDVAAAGDTVLLAAGEYRVTEALRLDKPLTMRGSEGRDTSIIMAVATNRCLQISALGSVVESLTLTGGVAPEGAGLHTVGGTLRRVHVVGNDASWGAGGGIMASGPLVLENCQIVRNQADVGGGIAARADLTLIGCVVSGNVARVDGGGISGGLTVTVEDSVLYGNRAGRDGGAFAGSHTTHASIHQTSVTANHAETGDGGGLLVRGRGQCELVDARLTDNRAAGRGGALCAWGLATLVRTATEDNQAPEGSDRFEALPASARGEGTP